MKKKVIAAFILTMLSIEVLGQAVISRAAEVTADQKNVTTASITHIILEMNIALQYQIALTVFL